MSEIEFHLLLDKNGIYVLLGNLLELDAPSVTYVERSLRMMKFFVRVLEEFSVEDVDEIVNQFSEIMGILEGYVEYSEL